MFPLEAVKYTLLPAVMVVSIVLGLRMVLAHDMRREAWRSGIKHRVYLSRDGFRRASLIVGWLLFICGMVVAYLVILDLMDRA